jgi:hypothetical protein
MDGAYRSTRKKFKLQQCKSAQSFGGLLSFLGASQMMPIRYGAKDALGKSFKGNLRVGTGSVDLLR